MDYIYKLPFILSIGSTIVVGMVNLGRGVDNQTIYLRMAVSLVVFYVIGLYLKNLIHKTVDNIREKREIDRQEEEKQKVQQNSAETDSKNSHDECVTAHIDLKAGEHEEDFIPLKASNVIKTKLSEHGHK
jgi:mannitol-specific phosphotransferase system IIBC component